MKIIVLAISFAAAVLSVNLHTNFSTGLSGQACLSLGPSMALAQIQKDSQPKITQPLPATPVRKIPPSKTVINAAGRPVISPGKTQPQQPAESQQVLPQPQYQEPQPIQQVEQPQAYMDNTSTAQSYQDQGIQPEQVNIPAPDTTSGTADSYTGVQTDMHRRTGGQGRGNIAGQPVQQVPFPQQGMPQPMPVQQDPQGGMPQGMPQGTGMQQAPMVGQPGMSGPCMIRLSEDRSSIALLDGSGQEINHIALGGDRVQRIFKSPDGNWNVLVFKVRRRQEYGAIAVNIAQCDPQEAREIRSMPENVEFQADEMLLMFPGNIVERMSLTHKTGP